MDADELYGLPLDRFTPERNALAKELRGSGRREEAAEVAALRKPSLAAWAVNQLVRTQRRAVGELFEAGDGLRAAHEQVLAGSGGGGTLRGAVERERGAVEALIGTARGLLTSQGHELSPAIIDRVAETLHAAALDDDARAQVLDGRLEHELRHVGLGVVAAGAVSARPPARPKPPAADRASAANPASAADRAAAEQAAREQAEARAAARVAEREARRRLERAERAAGAAAERRDRAAQALEQAEAELEDARAELEEAEAELREAERALGDQRSS